MPKTLGGITHLEFVTDQSQREWYRPWPATGEFDWSIRNNTNHDETGVLTALQYPSTLPKIVLEKQNYPDPNLRTYDDTAWTMGLMQHTDVKEIGDLGVYGESDDITGGMGGPSGASRSSCLMQRRTGSRFPRSMTSGSKTSSRCRTKSGRRLVNSLHRRFPLTVPKPAIGTPATRKRRTRASSTIRRALRRS
jgi:hypothetical protein